MNTNTDPVTPATPAITSDQSKNTLILTFLARNWLIVLLVIVSSAIFLNDEIFQKLGPLVWIVLGTTLWWLLSLFIVHIFFRQTIDADVHDGTYVNEWRSLTPTERMRLTVQYRSAIAISLALVIAACIK